MKKFYMPSLRPVGDENSTVGDGEDSVSSAAMTSKQNSDEEENSGNESGKDESFNDSEVCSFMKSAVRLGSILEWTVLYRDNFT